MEVIEGKITSYDERGQMTVAARYDNTDRLIKRRYQTVLIGLQDGRKASPEQIRKAHALIGEIADWSGEMPEQIKRLTKLQYIAKQQNELCSSLFSLGSCDITVAKEYITYLTEFILDWDVPTKIPLYELCDDIQKYIYACLKHKKCAVCGGRGELHHIDRIGMGNNRTDVCHEGMEAMSLCREHHGEIHNMGDRAFFAKYHFDGGVILDKELCKVYKLRAKK